MVHLETYKANEIELEKINNSFQTLDIKKNFWKDGDITEEPLNEYIQMAYSLGYIPVSIQKFNDDFLIYASGGVLVTMREGMRDYNNGFYILKQDASESYVMEVIVPNTCDKSTLITQKVQELENLVASVDMSELDTYDLVQVYSHVLANRVIKPISRIMFDNDKLKQTKFTDMYLARFLANVARYYIGDKNLIEEQVNAEPYLVKLMIDGNSDLGLAPHPEVEGANDAENSNTVEE